MSHPDMIGSGSTKIATCKRKASLMPYVCQRHARQMASHIYNVGELAKQLLAEGFFVRGAIVKGHLYHDKEMVFGEALLRAYRLEQEVVRFPRVMVTNDVAREVYEDFMGKRDISEFVFSLEHAEDGHHYLHVLSGVGYCLGPIPAQKRKSRRYYGICLC